MNVLRLTQSAILLIALLSVVACAPSPSASPTVSALPTALPPALAPTVAPLLTPSIVETLPAAAATAAAPTTAATSAPSANQVTLTLGPGRDATQPGKVTLEAQGDKTQVTLDMSGSTPGVAQPAHVHEGACPGVGAVKYPLTNVVDGKSVTVVDASLADLLKGDFAINVHKSTTEVGIYVACAAVAEAGR